MKRGIAVICAMMFLAGICRADVSSKAVTVSPIRGLPTQINLDLVSTSGIAGIQGQINYDPAIFSNPKVSGALGTPGFIVMGNMVAAGQYRFIAYANPTKSMTTFYTALQFQFDTATTLPTTGSRTITYTLEAASSTGGSSLSNVNFADVSVVFRRNAADDWAVYQ